MPLQPNQRCQSLTESVTLAIAGKAKKLKAEGVDVVSLSAGEPDFGTIDSVAEAGIQAIRDGQTRYTAAAGTPELRAAGAAWFQTEYGLDYSPAQVMATAGIKPALHMALMSILEPGDTVLLPAPYWVSYPSLVEIAGGRAVDVAAVPEQGFVHTGEQILAAAREHNAKGVMLNYPNNPTGAVPTTDQIKELVAAAVEADMWIISDEIYAKITYDGAEFLSPASLAPERTLVVNGGSKSHSLTGWRIGFLAGPTDIISAAAKMQSQAIGNPCSISQAAGLAATSADHQAEITQRVKSFDERRQYLVAALNKIDGLAAQMPLGAFYVMCDARQLCERLGIDDVELCSRLLDEAGLALVPGQPFAAPGFVRLSYAASMDDLQEAVVRLGKFAEIKV